MCFMSNNDPDPSAVPAHISASLSSLRCVANRAFVEAGYEITGEQWRAMIHIEQNPGLTHQELEPLLKKSQSATSKILQRLQDHKLLETLHSVTDRRCKQIYLNEHGIQLLGHLNEIANKVLENALRGISASDQRVLCEILKKIQVNLHNIYQIPLK